MKKSVRVLANETVYDGYFKLHRYRLDHTLFAGGWSAPIERELFDRGQVAAVLIYDPARDAILLVEQFRIGTLGIEEEPWLLEIVAGEVGAGEAPTDVARREALEEAGCTIGELTEIGQFFTSPGASSECVHLYFAESDLSDVGGLHGLAEEGEDIAVQVLPREDVFSMLHAGEFRNAKTVIALQWFALNFAQRYANPDSLIGTG